MKIRIFLFMLLCFLSFACLYPQNSGVERNYEIKGIVADSASKEKLEAASLTLYHENNILAGSGLSDRRGRFTLNIKQKGSYELEVSVIGYESAFIEISPVLFKGKTVDLGTVRLNKQSKTLSTVTITAKIPEVVVKEDTMEYNASAFKVPEGSDVETLIKRLPGVDVDDQGNIKTAAGKTVKRIFVDGKEFFGSDPKMATKNLNSDMIDKIQVVDKKSDLALLTGVEDDDPETIINITIKKGMKNGWMGNTSEGGGKILNNSEDKTLRYVARGSLNHFNDKQQLSFVTNTNNINDKGFTDNGNSVRSAFSGGGNGITNSSVSGINYNGAFGTKLNISAHASYNYSDTYRKSKSMSDNFLISDGKDSTFYRKSDSESKLYSNNFTMGGKIQYQPDTATTIIFIPSFSYNKSDINSSSGQETMAGDPDSTLVNSSRSMNLLHSEGNNAHIEVDFSRKLSSRGRQISISTAYGSNDNKGTAYNRSDNLFYLLPEKDKLLNQETGTRYNRNTFNFRITYVEPLGKNYFLNFSYNTQTNKTKNIRHTYDYNDSTGFYDHLNDDYSRSSQANTLSRNIRLSLRAVRTKYNYNIGVDIAPNNTTSRTYIEDCIGEGIDSTLSYYPNHKSLNLAPQAEFTYKLGNRSVRKSLHIRYSGSTGQPSVSQLDPTPNNTNPLYIRSGNPELLPSFTSNLSLRYDYNDRLLQKALSASLNYSSIRNDIADFTTYEENTGIQYIHPVNLNGSWNTSGSVFYSFLFGKGRKFGFTTHTGFSYNNEVGFSNTGKESVKNTSRTAGFSESPSLSYSNDWYYGQLRGNIRYSGTDYSIPGMKSRESYYFNVSYNTQFTFPLGWSLSSDINYTGNRGLSAGYNQNQILWNAQIAKSLFRKRQCLLRLQANDILHQKLNMSRSVSASRISDTQYTALTSFFLFSFSYRFNTSGRVRRHFSPKWKGNGQ